MICLEPVINFEELPNIVLNRGKENKTPQGQLWMEQYLTSLKYWPIWCTIWADPNYIWGLDILADPLFIYIILFQSIFWWVYG